MKKIMIMAAVTVTVGAAFAHPRGCGPCHPRPCHPRPYFHHGHDGWGRGGRNFWPGFVGGLVGGAVANSIVRPAPVVVTTPTVVTTPVVTTPVVVTQPVVTQPVVTTPVVTAPVVTAPVAQSQSVWVEGRYVDQVQANGTTVRVWQPGHYEQRTVL